SLNNIGVMYSYLDNHQKALAVHRRSMRIREALGDTIGVAHSLLNIGLAYNELDSLEQALTYYKSALALWQRSGDHRRIALVLNNLAAVYQEGKQYQKALTYYQDALKVYRTQGDRWGIAHTSINIGALLVEMKRFSKALPYITRGLQEARTIHARDIVLSGYEAMADYYVGMADYRRAWEYGKRASALKDSLFNEQSAARFAELQARYELLHKEQEIKLLQKEHALRAMELKRQETVRNVLLIGLVLVLAITLLTLHSYRLKQHSVKLEQAKNAELQSTNMALQQEIVQHRQTAEKLRESQEMLHAVLDNIPQRIYWKDCRGVYLGCNRNFARDAGVDSPEAIVGKTDEELGWREEEIRFFRKCEQEVIETDTPAYHVVEPQRRSNGQQAWLDTSRVPLHDAHNRVVGVLGMYEDITERILMQEQLAEEKERLKVTLQSIADGVIAADAAGRVTLMNPVAEELVGEKAAQALGRSLEEIVCLKDADTGQPVSGLREKILAGKPIAENLPHLVLQPRQGRERVVEVSAAPLQAVEGRASGVVLVIRDVTEQKKLQEELAQMQKLESIGLLAGGIAHDFNNILTGIMGNLSLARMYTGKRNRKLQNRLEEAEEACNRAKALTQQLLTFARGGEPVKEVTTVADLLTGSTLFALRGSNVRCEFDIAEDLWPAELDPGQMNQVIQNLVINADQAMPEGGILRVTARNVHLPQEGTAPLPPGKYIRISFQDQGVGISPEHLKKIFDPYFTTKQKGSGLGLAITHSIVTRHGGYIQVTSEPQKGSTFTVYIPASEKPTRENQETKSASAPGGHTVLVMDDDETIREIYRHMLNHLECEVEVTADGAEAIERFREAHAAGRPFDVVILDLTVPGGMGGREVLEKLREIDPEVRAIVASGYSNNPVLANYSEYGFRGCITKPFNLEVLSRTLEEVLQREPA
ncbi:MAG: PAS domain S-box protein, partial [Calditrichaeota bacterium]